MEAIRYALLETFALSESRVCRPKSAKEMWNFCLQSPCNLFMSDAGHHSRVGVMFFHFQMGLTIGALKRKVDKI